MKMCLSFCLIILGLGQAAFASHAHDRVCVGEISPEESMHFVFQYSIGRTYENGESSKDPHKIAVEAAYSPSDYLDIPATKFTSEAVTVNPQNDDLWTKIPLTLKSAKGEVLFTGTFNVNTETLTGTFTGEDVNMKATVKLACVAQPLLTLESSDKDITQ